MIKPSNFRQLHLLFSLFFLPVFLFALGLTPNLNQDRLLLVFIALHLFLYPSSNGYKSYFSHDKEDTKSMASSKKVTSDLCWLSLVFFGVSIIIGFLVSLSFSSMLLLYGLASMAYNHPAIHLKKHAWLSWFLPGLFQGYFIFGMSYAGLSDFGWDIFLKNHVLIPGFLTSLTLWGYYPLTQLDQQEDHLQRKRNTLRMKLGIKGTFLFSSLMFTITGIGFAWFFINRGQQDFLWTYLGAIAPGMVYFLVWFNFIRSNPEKYASYSWVKGMLSISVVMHNGFFIYFFLENTQILQIFAY